MDKNKRTSVINSVIAIGIICSITLQCIKLGVRGVLATETIAIILVHTVFTITFKTIWTRLTIFFISLMIFAFMYGENPDEFSVIIGYTIGLVTALFGIYVILRAATNWKY